GTVVARKYYDSILLDAKSSDGIKDLAHMEVGLDYRVSKITVASAPCEFGTWKRWKVHLSQRGISIKRFADGNVPAHEIDRAVGNFRIDASPCVNIIFFDLMRRFTFFA